MSCACVREQPDDAFEDLFEVEGRPDRRDDLVEEAFFDCCRRLPYGDPSILLVARREWKGRRANSLPEAIGGDTLGSCGFSSGSSGFTRSEGAPARTASAAAVASRTHTTLSPAGWKRRASRSR